jgi:hypothetical protein
MDHIHSTECWLSIIVYIIEDINIWVAAICNQYKDSLTFNRDQTSSQKQAGQVNLPNWTNEWDTSRRTKSWRFDQVQSVLDETQHATSKARGHWRSSCHSFSVGAFCLTISPEDNIMNALTTTEMIPVSLYLHWMPYSLSITCEFTKVGHMEQQKRPIPYYTILYYTVSIAWNNSIKWSKQMQK